MGTSGLFAASHLRGAGHLTSGRQGRLRCCCREQDVAHKAGTAAPSSCPGRREGLVSSFTAKWVCGGRIRALGFETKAFVPRRAAAWHMAAGISLSHVLLAEGFPRWLCPEVVLSLVVSCFTGGSENPERGSGCVSPSSHGMTDVRFPSLVRKIARHWDFCPVEGTRHCVPC